MQRVICVRLHLSVIASSRLCVFGYAGLVIESLHLGYSLEAHRDIHRLGVRMWKAGACAIKLKPSCMDIFLQH